MPRPMKSFQEKLWPKVDTSKGPDSCWEWQGTKSGMGYGHMSHGKKKTVGAHRVAFFLSNGYWPEIVMHTCDNPSCCNPLHLKPGTQKENIADMFKKGRQSSNLSHKNRLRGELNNKSKLTEQQVLEIRSSDLSNRKLSAKYNVDRRAIQFIKQRKTWKHV